MWKKKYFFCFKIQIEIFLYFFLENFGIIKLYFYKRVVFVIKGCDNDI